MSASTAKKLPEAVRQLLNRTFLATFKVQPRPASLSESMAVFQQIKGVIAPQGKIVHYRQSMCPVTKERLEKLQVLVEDFESNAERVDTVLRGEQIAPTLTKLESALKENFTNDADSRVKLEHATRDPDRILSLKFLQF